MYIFFLSLSLDALELDVVIYISVFHGCLARI